MKTLSFSAYEFKSFGYMSGAGGGLGLELGDLREKVLLGVQALSEVSGLGDCPGAIDRHKR